MKQNQIVSCVLIILLIACNDKIKYLESKEDIEARFVIKYYSDSIFISYEKYAEANLLNALKLVKKGEDYWSLDKYDEKMDEFVYISDKKIPDYIFLSINEHKTHIVDDLDLINDSILTYKKNSKYLTEIKANEKPVKKIFYYNEKFNIDSVIWIISKDTLIYK